MLSYNHLFEITLAIPFFFSRIKIAIWLYLITLISTEHKKTNTRTQKIKKFTDKRVKTKKCTIVKNTSNGKLLNGFGLSDTSHMFPICMFLSR